MVYEQEPEFYSNMRQHTDLCALVESRAREWVLLHALNTVCTTTHVCGERPCIEYLNDLVVRGIAWPVAAVACLFVVMVPSIITSMASRSMCHAFDTRARRTAGWQLHRQMSARDMLQQKSLEYAPFVLQTAETDDCRRAGDGIAGLEEGCDAAEDTYSGDGGDSAGGWYAGGMGWHLPPLLAGSPQASSFLPSSSAAYPRRRKWAALQSF